MLNSDLFILKITTAIKQWTGKDKIWHNESSIQVEDTNRIIH